MQLGGLNFGRIAIGSGVDRHVALEAIGHGMQQTRPGTGADLADQPCRHLVHRLCVVAIDLCRRQSERLGPRRDPLASGHRLGRCGRRNPVVLAYEQHRQTVHLRPVQTLQKRAAIGRAIAKKTGDDVRLPAQLQGMRGAGCNRNAGSDNAVGAQHADREIGNVHGAALALVVAAGAPEQLAHHGGSHGTFGQRVAMSAVGRSQQVFALQIDADASCHRLLPGGQMQRSAHQRRLD